MSCDGAQLAERIIVTVGVERGDADEPGEPGESVAERALDAFAVAVEYFHEQLDRDLPESAGFDNPREYFTEGRGWDHETVAEQRLGYAPADGTGLLDRLMREGFDRDAILGTGLFYESLDPHFRGRYVFPYFDADGEPVYAISRSLDERDGGHPNDPKGDQKYTKAIKTKDYSHVDEPIFGIESVDDETDRLLVAGGIADAIALQAADYACISPVTTTNFKCEHRDRVEQLLDDHGVERVLLVNDAERPSVSEIDDPGTVERIADALRVERWGEGLKGAFEAADWLLDADPDAVPYLVTLPGGGDDLDKIDPDDFIHEGWGSLDAVLASAKPAGQHRGFQAWRESRPSREIANARREIEDLRRDAATGANVSRLFSLDLTDVSGLSEGYRGVNPLGHHGESEDYFRVLGGDSGGDLYAYDHKSKVTYHALTYLLVDAGERHADHPTGSLSDREMLAAWLHAKREGLIPPLASCPPDTFQVQRPVDKPFNPA